MSATRVPECSCHHSGELLHADDCRRLVALVLKWKPPGLHVSGKRVAKRVVRDG